MVRRFWVQPLAMRQTELIGCTNPCRETWQTCGTSCLFFFRCCVLSLVGCSHCFLTFALLCVRRPKTYSCFFLFSASYSDGGRDMATLWWTFGSSTRGDPRECWGYIHPLPEMAMQISPFNVPTSKHPLQTFVSAKQTNKQTNKQARKRASKQRSHAGRLGMKQILTYFLCTWLASMKQNSSGVC